MTTTTYPKMAPAPSEEQYAAIAAAQRKAVSRRDRMRDLSMQVGALVVIIVLWVLAARNAWVTPLLLPKLTAVLGALEHGLIRGEWWWHIGVTLQETALGFVIGAFLGMVVGALFAFVKPLRTAFYPYVVALMSFPKIAIAPLLIVAFGYAMTPKVIIATMLARATLPSVASSPVARIAFMCESPHASRKRCTSSYIACQFPVRTWPRVMTMSISFAPAATDARISRTRSSSGLRPAGKPVLTAATGIPVPARASTAVGTIA